MKKIDIVKIKGKNSYSINDLKSLCIGSFDKDSCDEIIVLDSETGIRLARIEFDLLDRPLIFFY